MCLKWILGAVALVLLVVLGRIFFSRRDWSADAGFDDGSKKQHRDRPL
jgi:hypothetical protein